MAKKIAFFGPVASGKSTYLRRARQHFPCCLTVEMDEVVLDKDEQARFAKGVLSCSFGNHLFMTAGKLDVSFLRQHGVYVVRVMFADKARYLKHVCFVRNERIGSEYTEAELSEWYKLIANIPSGQFAVDIFSDQVSEEEGWSRIRQLVDGDAAEAIGPPQKHD